MPEQLSPEHTCRVTDFSSCRNYWGEGKEMICLPPQYFHGERGRLPPPPPPGSTPLKITGWKTHFYVVIFSRGIQTKIYEAIYESNIFPMWSQFILFSWPCDVSNSRELIDYTGWPIQKRNCILPTIYVDAITSISILWGNLLLEKKWYQDQQLWFSSY